MWPSDKVEFETPDEKSVWKNTVVNKNKSYSIEDLERIWVKRKIAKDIENKSSILGLNLIKLLGTYLCQVNEIRRLNKCPKILQDWVQMWL